MTTENTTATTSATGTPAEKVVLPKYNLGINPAMDEQLSAIEGILDISRAESMRRAIAYYAAAVVAGTVKE